MQQAKHLPIEMETPSIVVQHPEKLVEVACPHPGCSEKTGAPTPDGDTDITVTRSAALFGDYRRLHCPNGHTVFVHYC